MFRRRSSKPDAINASPYSRRAAIADSAWAAQDRLRAGAAAALAAAVDAVRWPFERLAFALEERVLWPVGDRAATAGTPARALSYAALVLIAAAAGVAGLVWAAPDGPHQTSSPVAVTVATAPLPTPAAAKPAEPTLQGATPVFEPVEADRAEVDPAKAIDRSQPADRADGASGSSPDAGGAATASSSGKQKSPALDGPPAGPEAIAVARDFAAAFVSYETGESDSTVRRAFGKTATPALAKALLRRPPRLPANVEVPKAKVLNVVPAPSHGGIYPISVSLLRVGLTSELRLEMEELKGDGWRVTNVLG
jgi:hypothetical protein